MSPDKMEAINNATRDQMWREAEKAVGYILQISLFGPQTPEDVQLVKGVFSLVASEIVSRIRDREKDTGDV